MLLIGDNRKYCSALITLDMSVILRDNMGIDPNNIPKDPTKQNKLIVENGKKLSDYTNNKDVYDNIQHEIEKLNQKFSSPEQIKKFSILPRDFSIDDGELTPTLKIRRKQINENWLETIESLYEK